jgi:hypothetical protein
MTADQLLHEAIIDLQKQDLPSETRSVVDEAARLLLEGRDIEARALFEKAQAMAVPLPPPNKASTAFTRADPGPQSDGRIAPLSISRLSNRLAVEIENALNETIEDLSRNVRA